MRMMVRCGNEECENVFYVDSKDPLWECPECGREIVNSNYPFLTAKLMQAKIDGDSADWKTMFVELVEQAETEISSREGRGREGIGKDLFSTADDLISSSSEIANADWKKEYDRFLVKTRELILSLEG